MIPRTLAAAAMRVAHNVGTVIIVDELTTINDELIDSLNKMSIKELPAPVVIDNPPVKQLPYYHHRRRY